MIVHLDMDCFFASVATVGRPVLRGKPIAVCHSNSNKGTGEVSAANYEARAFGIRAGSFIYRAKELCPNLIVMPYEFEKYQEISEKVELTMVGTSAFTEFWVLIGHTVLDKQVYRIALTYTKLVQPVSCDEAFMDITGLGEPCEIVSSLRDRILKETGCTASAGIGPNLLLSRLATKRAKPNGQFRILQTESVEFVANLPVGDLPGGFSAFRFGAVTQ